MTSITGDIPSDSNKILLIDKEQKYSL